MSCTIRCLLTAAFLVMATPSISQVAMADGRSWTGSVTSGRGPLEEADIRIKWMRDVPGGKPKLVFGSRATTGADGTYEVVIPKKLRADQSIVAQFKISKPGYLTRDVPPISLGELLSEDRSGVSAGARTTRSVLRRTLLRKGRVISGQVRLPSGRPASGAEVIVSTRPGEYDWKFFDPDRYYATDTVITDRQGHFQVIGDVRASMRVRMPEQAEYSVALLPESAPNNPQPLTHDVTMPEPIRVRGTIVDEHGDPVRLAIVRYRRSVAWNPSAGPLGLSVFTVANKDGQYELPPVPEGTYQVTVNSRLSDASKRNELMQHALTGNYGAHAGLYGPLDTVIPDATTVLSDQDDAPQVDLSGVPTKRINVTITQDDPVGTQPKRAPLIPITGEFNGKRWSGYSVPTAPASPATFLVPKGLQNVRIQFGYALVKEPGEKKFRNATSININRVDTDLDGYAIHLTSLARVEAKIQVPAELSISKVGTLSVFLTTCPTVGPTTKKQFGRTEIAGRTTKFSVPLPPNVKYWLHVETGERSLASRELTLKPGERRQLKIDLRKTK